MLTRQIAGEEVVTDIFTKSCKQVNLQCFAVLKYSLGPKITRSSSWRNSDSFRDERSFGEEEWQVARGPRVRSFHERDDRWNNPSEPEWCKDDDFEDLDVTGTFDSSGAFRSQKVIIV